LVQYKKILSNMLDHLATLTPLFVIIGAPLSLANPHPSETAQHITTILFSVFAILSWNGIKDLYSIRDNNPQNSTTTIQGAPKRSARILIRIKTVLFMIIFIVTFGILLARSAKVFGLQSLASFGIGLASAAVYYERNARKKLSGILRSASYLTIALALSTLLIGRWSLGGSILIFTTILPLMVAELHSSGKFESDSNKRFLLLALILSPYLVFMAASFSLVPPWFAVFIAVSFLAPATNISGINYLERTRRAKLLALTNCILVFICEYLL
jgi:hypothetical protein